MSRFNYEGQDHCMLTCYSCGVRFTMPSHMYDCRRENKATFWCPNGHQQAFVESEADKLRRERDNLKQQMARVEDERLAAEQRADLAEKREKRLKKRAASGTCPFCQRTFSNMNTHMRKQHPEFVAANVVKMERKA